MVKKASRSGGRKGRIAVRTAPVAQFNPCPPGQTGGQFKPLSTHQVEAILNTALDILSQIGMGEVPERLSSQAISKGAQLSNNGRLLFPRAMTEDIIDNAARSFVLHGRDPKHDIEIGGERVFFGTGGAAVQTLDLETGDYRSSTLKDLYDFARLADVLDNISWFTRCCIATDIEDIFELDVNTAFALLAGTSKPIGTSFTLGGHVEPIVGMFDMALGGEGRFRDKPFCQAHISPVVSPLRYGEDAFEVALECMRLGVPINAIIAAQSGATAPAAPAGMLAQTLAETLAGLAMVNVFEPGYPVIFSNWPFVIDLRTGSFSGSGGEISLMNAAAAQLSNHLGLPSGVASCMADSKAVDAQMGAEKAVSAVASGLAGANMVYESAGMMASLLGVSFEALVLDNEMLAHIHRMIRGIEVNADTLGFEAIQDTVNGDGHFLGSKHTMAAMERDYFYPPLANRDAPSLWQEKGKPESRFVARDHAREILDSHFPAYLEPDVVRKIRGNFPILLVPREMRQSKAEVQASNA